MTLINLPALDRRTFLRGALVTAGVAAVGGSLAGCVVAPAPATGTVGFWDWYVTQASWVDNEIALFQKANPGLTIEKTTQVTDKYPELAALAQRSDSLPEVLMIPKAPTIQEQVAAGWYLPLDDYITDEWKSRFPEGVFVEGINTFDGKVYTAPFAGIAPSVQLYVHNEIFRTAGLTNSDGSVKVPATWDDVTKAAAAIKSKIGGSTYGIGFGNSDAPLIGAWWVDMFTRGAGSPGGTQTVDYRTGEYTYSSDRNYADFLEMLVDWKNNEYIHPNVMSMGDEQARAEFAKGSFGMTVGGVWNQPSWTEAGFTDYSLMTLPSPTGKPKSFFYGAPGSGFIAISATAADPDAAWKWFDWLNGVDAGKRWVQDRQGLSIFPENNVAENVDFEPFAQYAAMADMAKYGPAPTIRNPEVSKVAVGTVTPAINDVCTGIFTGQLGDIGTALSEVQDATQQALQSAIDTAAAAGANVSIKDYVFSDWDPTQTYITTASA